MTRTATRADALLDALRDDIVNGHVAPGSRLGYADLREQYGASSGVVREVLQRLTEQGLVTSIPQVGARVMTLSRTELTELTEARVAIERAAIAVAAERGDLEWETEVVAAHHVLVRTPFTTSDALTSAWLPAHAVFHRTVLEGSGNRYLVESAARLRTLAEVYRAWAHLTAVEDNRDIEDEHRQIMESVLARDASSAMDAIERHIRLTTELLLAGRESSGHGD